MHAGGDGHKACSVVTIEREDDWIESIRFERGTSAIRIMSDEAADEHSRVVTDSSQCS